MAEIGFDLPAYTLRDGTTVPAQTITVESDPLWGDMKALIKSCVTIGQNNQPQIDMMGFLDKLLDVVIIRSTGSFDIKNRTMIAQIPSSVMTKVVGEVTNIVPLQQYLDNMGTAGKLLNPQ